MKRFAGLTAITGGLLLLIIPRFVFPACEYVGRGRMYCTDTAHAEFAAGGMLVATGATLLFLEAARTLILAAGSAVVLFAAAFVVPSVFRVCGNPDMACHYGMAPGVRFVAGVFGLAAMAALTGLVRAARRLPG